MRVLHLGCGQSKQPGAVGVDLNPRSAADVRCDLNRFAYPFADNSFELVLCEHVLEHLDDVISVMEEIHRIGQAGARVVVRVPHFSSVYYYADPTHRHPFALHSFDYFLPGTAVHEFHYSPVEFRLVRAGFPAPAGSGALKRAVFKWINRFADFYERRLAFILPRHLLEFELDVVKPADRD
jgi:SAM-dependent methyltransferase